MFLESGDFVVLEEFTSEMLSESIGLTEVPGPSYERKICGTVKRDELCVVILTELVTHPGDPVLQDLYAKILTPSGAVGWINTDYLEMVTTK